MILCNNLKMMREHLSISGAGLGTEHRESEDDYVYDLYYQETVTPGWIQDILSVRAYADEGELVCKGHPLHILYLILPQQLSSLPSHD